MPVYFRNLHSIPVISSVLFFVFSITFHSLNVKGMYETLPSILNFFLIFFYFLYFCFKDNIFKIYPWFLIVSASFISVGTFASYLRYAEDIGWAHDNLTSSSKMVTISFANSFNSLSLLIISVICYFSISKIKFEKVNIDKLLDHLIFYKTFLFSLLFGIFFLNFYIYMFNEPTNYVLSILSKINIVKLGIFLLVSLIFKRLDFFNKILLITFVIIEFLFLLTFFSKFLIIQNFLILFIGLWFNSKNKLFTGISFSLILITIFYLLSIIINISRGHDYYYENRSDLKSKFIIVKDSLNLSLFGTDFNNQLKDRFKKNASTGFSNPKLYRDNFQNDIANIYLKLKDKRYSDQYEELTNKLKENIKDKYGKEFIASQVNNYFGSMVNKQRSTKERIVNFINRLDVLSTQRFIIKQKIKGHSSDSFKNILYLFVPRIIWSEKPVITNNGIILHNLLYNESRDRNHHAFQNSSLGPSVHIEAFWNFGYFGLIVCSILLGVFLSICSNFYLFLNNKTNLLIYFIVFPSLIKIILFYESWVISFLGEFIILISISLLCALVIFIYKKINSLSMNLK